MDQFSTDFASRWDELVGWEKRSAADFSFLLGLLEKYKCRSVLDVALGTGFHSVKLLDSALRVKSVDISKAMIDVAKENANRHGVELDVICADWIELSEKIEEKFDCVLCLGNSLACEMDANKRQMAIQNWSQVLSENGIVIVDRRNYEALLHSDYNVNSQGLYFGESVKITSTKVVHDETIFSYTFADGRTFDLKMFPILDSEIKKNFENADLEAVEIYGDRKSSYVGMDVAFYLYVFKRVANA